jgi:ankyrin repeat protein
METLEKNLFEGLWTKIDRPVNLELVKTSKYYPYFLIMNGDLDKLKEIDSSLEQTFTNGYNAYHLAIWCNHIHLFDYLETKCELHYLDKLKRNYYLFACWCGKKEIMDYLEMKGLDINHKDIYGYNAYLMAVYKNKKKIMEYLEKEKGFNINVKNKHGNNAYLIASMEGHLDIMKILEEKGFDIEYKNFYDMNAYTYALFFNRMNVLNHFNNKNYKYDNTLMIKLCKNYLKQNKNLFDREEKEKEQENMTKTVKSFFDFSNVIGNLFSNHKYTKID